jgi:hypothetical protein
MVVSHLQRSIFTASCSAFLALCTFEYVVSLIIFLTRLFILILEQVVD